MNKDQNSTSRVVGIYEQEANNSFKRILVKNPLKISVVVPAYNEEGTIGACLESLLCQDYAEYEIIVVDGGSVDGTLDIVREFMDRSRRIVLLHEKPRINPANARNIGMKRASGEIIIFKDADAIVEDTDFLRIIDQAFARSEVDLVSYRVDPICNSDRLLERSVFFMHYGIRMTEPRQFAFRKELLLKIGGFDFKLGYGDDVDLTSRAMSKAVRIVCAHARPIRLSVSRILSIGEFLSRYVWYGRTYFNYFRKYPSLLSLLQAFGPGLLLVAVTTLTFFFPMVGLALVLGGTLTYAAVLFKMKKRTEDIRVVLLTLPLRLLSRLALWFGMLEYLISGLVSLSHRFGR